MSDADSPDRPDGRNSPEDTQPLRVVRPQDRQRWEPLPQGNEYEQEATAFVQLPDGFTSGPYPGGYGYPAYPDPHQAPGAPDGHGGAPGHDGYGADPLAAPGHGYTPPSSFAPPTTGAATDPSATGQWTMPFADAPATGLPAHGMPDPGPHGHYADGGQDAVPHDAWPGADGGSGTTGQWAIPTAPDEVLEESGEYLLGDDRNPASGYGNAYGHVEHGHLPADPAATGHWNFTTDQHPGAGHLPYDQPAHQPPHQHQPPQQHRPADQVTPGYDPAHGVPPASEAPYDGGTLGGGNWSLPADALAQWPPMPREEVRAEPEPEAVPEPEPVVEVEAEAPGDAPVETEAGTAEADTEVPVDARTEAGTGEAGTDEPRTDEPRTDTTADASAVAPEVAPEAAPATVPAPAEDDIETAPESATEAPAAPEPVAVPEVPAATEAEAPEGEAPETEAPEEAPAEPTAQQDATSQPAPAVEAQEPTTAADPAVAGPTPEPAPDPLPAPHDNHDEHPHTSYVLTVNGTDRPVTDAWIGESLLYVLRERLGLAGAKDGCSQGECGACSVQVDGRLVASCLVPAATTAGSEVRTVEGLARNGAPSDVQRALADSGAVQCGFCIPGMAMTVHDLLEGNHAPTELETRQALCGNLCRCSGYRGVLDAVNEVARNRADAAAAAEEAAAAAPEEPGTPRIPQQAGPADPQGPASHGHHPHGPHPHGPGADPQSGGSA
ncbi:2Fe-2S iron-sulfur cluster-binding protein [Streptomyces rimosus]|uniref:2Fe-2S iron-sulfur cluster-binding protein n=1 Tax=Streptomyces rimosus TaxID=1927 RepID=UPI0037927306